MPDVVKQNVKFIPVETMDEVVAQVFQKSSYRVKRHGEKDQAELPMISTVSGSGAVMMDEI